MSLWGTLYTLGCQEESRMWQMGQILSAFDSQPKGESRWKKIY